jgi:two-component system, LuxR family, sensor kinase FixL
LELDTGKSAVAKPVHLLLIEDEEAHAALIQRAFQEHTPPVEITVVPNLQKAYQCLHRSSPDLVIADLRLPDGSGIELLSQPNHRSSCPVIVMTSYGDESRAVEAMKAGALDYIVKSEAALLDMPHIAERALRQWHEISERKRAEQKLRVRASQLTALSQLTHHILSGMGTKALMKETAKLISQTLTVVPYVKILELLPEQKNLLVRAATGEWNALVDQTIPLADQDPLTKQILTAGEVVFVKDIKELRTDDRFQGTPLLKPAALVSGVGLPLCGQDRLLGVIWVGSAQQWTLTQNELNFLELIGNTLVVAIERKERETRMRKLQSDLLQASRLSALGELGSTLAHEINQPITAVINYVQACQQLIRSGKGEITSTVQTLMEKAVAETERTARIIHRLREFVCTGKLHQALEALNPIIYDASKLALGDTAEAEIKVNFELSEQLPLVYIDKIQIQQVVFNLVCNAVEALKNSEKKLITIRSCLASNQMVEVQIQDTGPGIDPQLKDNIFQRRVSTKEGGMGMGLSISYSIIRAHQGDLWVSTPAQEGTIFHFTVPPTKANPAAD